MNSQQTRLNSKGYFVPTQNPGLNTLVFKISDIKQILIWYAEYNKYPLMPTLRIFTSIKRIRQTNSKSKIFIIYQRNSGLFDESMMDQSIHQTEVLVKLNSRGGIGAGGRGRGAARGRGSANKVMRGGRGTGKRGRGK